MTSIKRHNPARAKKPHGPSTRIVRNCPAPKSFVPSRSTAFGAAVAPGSSPVSELVAAIAAEVMRLLGPKLASITPNVIQPALLDVKQAAIYLGRSEQSVQHLIFEKELPVVRSGRRVHLRRADLDRWIERNTY